MFFSPFSIAITSLGELERELIVVLFVRLFDLRWFGFVLFPLPLGVWDGLRLMIVAPGIFFYLLFQDVIHVPKNFHVEVQLWICVENMLKPSVTNHSYPQTSAHNIGKNVSEKIQEAQRSG